MKNLIALIILSIFSTALIGASVFEFSIKKHIKEASGPAKDKIITSGKTLLDIDEKIERLKDSIDAHKNLLKTEENRLFQSGLSASARSEINKNIQQLKNVISDLQKEMSRHEDKFSSMLVDFNALVENK